jgi:flavin reductase (DIM6/NTAB) family NADH-FMN oxidoreductase RutF
MKLLLSALLASLLAGSALQASADSAVAPDSAPIQRSGQFVKIEPQQIQGNLIKLVGSEWMLISAGTESSFNGMTASWGGFGVWNKPVAFILVRDSRHTYEFLEREDFFTLSFFDEKYKPALQLYGSKSGRDMDKAKEAGLTPLATKPGVAYAEARLIVVCKKTYAVMTKPEDKFPKTGEAAGPDYHGHKLFFGEIVDVWQRK